MRHRRLFLPWLAFASRLVPYGTLERRDTELSVLRVAWNCRCRYEWAQHVQLARHAGLTQEEVGRVCDGSSASGWTPHQVALLDAVDEIHAARSISELTWQRLGRRYRPQQLIELCMLVGHYEMVAGLLNSLAVPLDVRIERSMASMTGGR
jgi:AhpD family alkylhydroperoxidase